MDNFAAYETDSIVCLIKWTRTIEYDIFGIVNSIRKSFFIADHDLQKAREQCENRLWE